MQGSRHVDRGTLAAGLAVLAGIALATLALPLAHLATASTATTEGGGGSVVQLFGRVLASVYFGQYGAEVLGWSRALLAVLGALALVWLVVARPLPRGVVAIAVFCGVLVASNYLVYSNALNAIGFTPNLIVMYGFIPLVGLAGAAASWLFTRVLSAEPALRPKSLAYVVLVALAVAFAAKAGQSKAVALRQSARQGTFVKLQDVAGLEWIRDHTSADEGVVVDGLADAGFWAPALAGRRTLFWYAGWPSLPPWQQLKGSLREPPDGVWELVHLQLVGGDVTVRGLGPTPGSGMSAYLMSGSKGSASADMASDAVTVHMPEGNYVLALLYQPDSHPDAGVSVTVATPGGGRRVFKASDDQMRRRYFAEREAAYAAMRGGRSTGLMTADFAWVKLRREGYRYVFVGSTVGDPERRIFDRPALSRDPALKRVWGSAGATVYEILEPEPAAKP